MICMIMACPFVSVQAKENRVGISTGPVILKDVSGTWKHNSSGWWFQYSSGGYARSKWEEIKGNWYYFDDSGYSVTGFRKIDGSWYYFYPGGEMLTGWYSSGNKWYYFTPETGVMRTDWYLIDGQWYYFRPTGELATRWVRSRGTWFYMGGDGAMKYGWVYPGDGWYYMDPKTGKLKTGWQKIDGSWYYLSGGGRMTTGWQYFEGSWYYLGGNGIMQTGWIFDGASWYYMDEQSGAMRIGWLQLGDTWYYLDPARGGAMCTSSVQVDGAVYQFNASGVWVGEAVQYTPVYYSQRDSRWASMQFGAWNLHSAGCVPSSLAMILSALKNQSILPPEVATWLYNNTDEYNRRSIGGGGLCAVYAAEHWGLRSSGLGSADAIRNELAAGKMIIAYEGPGAFASGGSHAIVLFKISGDSTYVYDSFDSSRNGWYSISSLWAQRSSDPDDNKGGYVFYSIYK